MNGEGLTPDQIERLKQDVVQSFIKASNEPFKVSIVGQTGVGKSSLLNALFGTNLKTDPIRPCTKEIERVVIKGKSGHELWFYDLPGIGESDKADSQYLEQYGQKLLESDVLLWAIHADSRSVVFDLQALHQVLSFFNDQQKAQLMSKITFVLTKADTLSPPPWILGRVDNYGIFSPTATTREILEQKSEYYQQTFLQPFGSLIISYTHCDSEVKISDGRFSYEKRSLFYQGFLDAKTLTQLKSQYPEYSDVLERLHHNYKIVPCSSLFRFNLTQLMLVIVNKLGREAITRFNHFINDDTLNQVPFSKAKEFCNLRIFDIKTKKKIFDLTETKI
jgi:predicted GTPase